MFRWFETRIAAFPEDRPERPPETLLAFYTYFILPVWPAFAALLVAGLVGSLIEVALMTFVGRIVDLMKAPSPAHFITDHGTTLLWMAFVAVVSRPSVSPLHARIQN
jgi:ATP-binding cassette subfamily B multidrug efflux pump